MKLPLDFTLKTFEERCAYCQKVIDAATPEELTPSYLEYLSDKYLLTVPDRQWKKNSNILTDNRMVTINKHEISYEGICDTLENGEDGLYGMMSDLGKGERLTIQDPITEQDYLDIPELVEQKKAIEQVEKECAAATGRRKYMLKRALIEMHQQLKIIRNEKKRPWRLQSPTTNSTAKMMRHLDIYDDIRFDENGDPHNYGLIDFFNPKHMEALLCNYTALKDESADLLNSDLKYLMMDLDEIIERTLKTEYPMYFDIFCCKVNNWTNLEIQTLLLSKYGQTHTVEYISALWRNKIPKLLAENETKHYLEWYYMNVEVGKWKKCSRCGESKLAHNRFFSKNSSSKDGWYSICKDCRNKRLRAPSRAKAKDE